MKMSVGYQVVLFLILCLFRLSAAADGFTRIPNADDEDDDDVKRSDFPDDFLWGTATSAYQIEGGYLEDGKSLNNWDVFSRVPGRRWLLLYGYPLGAGEENRIPILRNESFDGAGSIRNGDTGDVADDHYHRFMEDIAILQSLGVNAYRFSVSWSRILPRGRRGGVNRRGIMFYNEIIDNLLRKGIKPFVTIHHHDHPNQFEQEYGAWLSPLIQEEYVEFAKTCFEEFGDRVKYWTTINEPNIFSLNAYLRGLYPPAHCSIPFGNCTAGNSNVEPLLVSHNMLLAHAKAASLYRHHYQPKQGGLIGIVASARMLEPYGDNEFDRQAVSRALAFDAGWVLDPLVHGDYPLEMRQLLGKELPEFSKEERSLVKGSVDFLAINHYTTLYAIDCLHSPCAKQFSRPIQGYVETTGVRDGILIGEPSGMRRFFTGPRGMEKIMIYMSRRYPNLPLFVTENGYADKQGEINTLLDFARIRYHKGYLAALTRAIRKGANVRGYFVWSLMDNMEWAMGYSVRFGLYYVNRTSLSRVPKLSALWYSSFLANQTFRHPLPLRSIALKLDA